MGKTEFISNIKTILSNYKIKKHMKHVQQFENFLNAKNTFNEDINEATVGEKHNNYYIANKDTQVWSIKGGPKTYVPSGTVINSSGGGYWKSINGSIATGTDELEGNPDFDVVNDTTWPMIQNLIDEIEDWGRNTGQVIQKDPKKAQAIINNRLKAINDMRKLLK